MASLCYIKGHIIISLRNLLFLSSFVVTVFFWLLNQLLKSLLGTLSLPQQLLSWWPPWNLWSVHTQFKGEPKIGGLDLQIWFSWMRLSLFCVWLLQFPSSLAVLSPTSLKAWGVRLVFCINLHPWVWVPSWWGSHPFWFLLLGLECSLFSIWFDCLTDEFFLLFRVYNYYLWSG